MIASVRRHPFAAGFVLHLCVYSLLLRRSMDWDGLWMIMGLEHDNFRDFAHILYPAWLKMMGSILAPLGFGIEVAGKWFSALSASFVFVLLWRLFESLDMTRRGAVTSALLVTTTPVLWIQSVSLEVYTPSLAFLAAAALMARGYAVRPCVSRMTLTWFFFLLAMTIHLLAALALPGIVALMGRTLWHRRVAVHLAFPVIASLLLALLVRYDGVTPAIVWDFWLSARGFLTPVDSFQGALDLVFFNLWKMWTFFLDEGPVISLLGLMGLVVLAWKDRRLLVFPLAWLLPFLLGYIAFGVPLMALLLPVFPAMGFLAGRGADVLPGRARRWGVLAVSTGLLIQVGWALPDRWHDATSPDPMAQEARAIHEGLPQNSAIMAGSCAAHLLFHTDAVVISVPDVMHTLKSRDGRAARYFVALEEEIDNQRRQGREIWIEDGAFRIMLTYGLDWKIIYGRLVENREPIVVRSEPRLALYRAKER